MKDPKEEFPESFIFDQDIKGRKVISAFMLGVFPAIGIGILAFQYSFIFDLAQLLYGILMFIGLIVTVFTFYSLLTFLIVNRDRGYRTFLISALIINIYTIVFWEILYFWFPFLLDRPEIMVGTLILSLVGSFLMIVQMVERQWEIEHKRDVAIVFDWEVYVYLIIGLSLWVVALAF